MTKFEITGLEKRVRVSVRVQGFIYIYARSKKERKESCELKYDQVRDRCKWNILRGQVGSSAERERGLKISSASGNFLGPCLSKAIVC